MTKFTEEQLKQQWMWKQMTPEQQQQYRVRIAQRASQQQNGQPQGQQQQVSRPSQQQNGQPQGLFSPQQQQQLQREQFARLSPERQHLQQQQQRQLRQQQNARQRPNPMQFPPQSFNNTQLPGFSSMAPPASPNHTRGSLQAQASPRYSPVPTVSSNSLSGANILMTGNSQQQRQNAARSSPINGTSVPRPYAPSPLSVSSPIPTLTMTASPQHGARPQTPTNASSPTQYKVSPTLSANSHMPTLPPSITRTQNAGPGQQHQQANASNGSTQSRQPRMSPSNAAPRQGHPHAQTNQQSSSSQKGYPPIAGQKRQATDAPEGTRPADKRPNLMPQSGAVNHANPVRQNAAPFHQPAAYRRVNGMPNGAPNGAPNGVPPTTKDPNLERREQQAQREAERHRIREYQAKVAEQARVAEEYQVAHAATLQREKDDKRREELRKDPSANYRHILEVYKLIPLKKGELPNRYLTGLIANRPMPMDLDSDLALAITFAKDHWDYYGQWPKDITRFAGYEKARRAKQLA